MSGWGKLADSLTRARDAGALPAFWWRDDDATAPTPELEALLATAAGADLTVALAVIPQRAEAALAERLADETAVTVLQHGYAHQNHAPLEEKKTELGGHRPAEYMVADLAMGLEILRRRFGDRFRPVLVPPWNRILPKLVPMLPEFGLHGLSAFGPRTRAEPVARLRQINTHLDPIDWRGDRRFVGDDAALAALCDVLDARADGRADAAEPLGVLTHHLVDGAACFAFLARLAEVTREAGAVWRDPAELFTDD